MNLWDFIVTMITVILGSIACMIGAILIGAIIVLVIVLGSFVAIVLGIFKVCIAIADYFNNY